MDLADRLEGLKAKLRRADEHLQTVREEEAEYSVAAEYGPRTRFERSIPERAGQAGLACRAFLDPGPPPRLGVLCGDVVHSLRSALDHLANALVAANAGTPREGPGGTKFPIRVGGGISIVHEPGAGIAAAAHRILELLQPRVANDPLALLNTLSNVDKHRTLNVIIEDLGQVRVTEVPEHLRSRLELEEPPFVHDQLIYSIVGSGEELGEMWHAAEYSPALAFADLPGGRAPVVETLEGIFAFVRDDVVQRFARECLGGKLDLPAPIF